LNDSLKIHAPECVISWNEHLSKYDGLKTKQKLEMLTQEKGLKIEHHSLIWDYKQKITNEKLVNTKRCKHRKKKCTEREKKAKLNACIVSVTP
jgi:hypothetical protein